MSFPANWAARVAKRLLPLSVEQEDLAIALKEWAYTGVCEDHGIPCEVCQMCGQEDLRYHFEIENSTTYYQLWVGSECIQKFSIDAYNEYGERLEGEEATELVKKHRAQLIEAARIRRVDEVINLCIEYETSSNLREILERCLLTHRNGSALSPKQMATLGWRLKYFKIPHRPNDFRVALRRGKHKDDFVDLKDYQIKMVARYLSPQQRLRYGL